MARLATALVVASVLHASLARAQGSTADSLARLLTTTDIHERALAVARLNALPLAELTPGARAALVELLDAEATKRVPLDAEQPADEDETYDEYIIDLTDAVLRLRDPASLRGLTLLGIQTGQDVQRYVASLGAASLPALDEAWNADPEARPTILTTWALALANTGADALGIADRERLLGTIVGATDALPIAVAGAARAGSLTALVPALADVAGSTASDVVRSRAEKAVELLAPLRDGMPPARLLDEMIELTRGYCENPGLGGGPAAHPNRPATCGVLGAEMNKARAALRTGRADAARAALGDASATAASGRSSGALTAAEAAVVQGNVAYLLTRI